MKKILISTAFLLVALQGTANAVDDERILEAIKAGIDNPDQLCAKLKTLPQEDLQRLSSYAGFGEATTPAQKAVKEIIDTHANGLKIESCLNQMAHKATW